MTFLDDKFNDVIAWQRQDGYRIQAKILTPHPLEIEEFDAINKYKLALQETNKRLKCSEIHAKLDSKLVDQKIFKYKYVPPVWISDIFGNRERNDNASESKEIPAIGAIGSISKAASEEICEALDILSIDQNEKNHPLFFLGHFLLNLFFSVDCFLNQQLCHHNLLQLQKNQIFNESTIFKKALDSGLITHFYTDTTNEFEYGDYQEDFRELWKNSLKFVQLVCALIFQDPGMGFEDLRRVLSSLGFSPFTAITISFDCKSLNKGLEKDVQLSQLLEELEGKLKYKF